MHRVIISLLLLLVSMGIGAQSLLPEPQSVVWSGGHCPAGRLDVKFRHLPSADRRRLSAFLHEAFPPMGIGNAGSVSLTLSLAPKAVGKEGYRLTVTPQGIALSASTGAGLFYGLQTLSQLRDAGGRVACCEIQDEPRYPWRGLMIDISRHFFDKASIEKQIDAMAHYKLNTLHLHLTDAAGWRLQIKRYPDLTRKAAWRSAPDWKSWWNGNRQYRQEGDSDAHGGYLTQRDAREIVAYARERYINVVPEIEMPAHSEEVLAAYPLLACAQVSSGAADFCPGNEKTYEFLENVLTEVMDIFPSAYIHVGGDEAGMAAWPKCPLCQQRMREEGMTDVKQLQGYLIRRIGRFLQRHGRKLVGWDEILSDSVPTNAVTMVWRDVSEARKAMQRGIPVVLSPGAYCYLDAYQDAPSTQPEAIGGYLPLERVYSYNPPDDPLVMGIQGNLWTEYVPTLQHLEYMLWPRAMAIAELGWTRNPHKDYAGFRKRALAQDAYLRQRGYHAFDLLTETGQRPQSLRPVANDARGCKVSYNDAPYSLSYPAGGDSTLTDGWRGGWHYSDRRWQGFIGKGFDATVDLGRVRTVDSVSMTFMQQTGPEVFLPAAVELLLSSDGTNFETAGIREPDSADRDKSNCYADFVWSPRRPARYVRVKARHGQRGGWLFTDEIVVNCRHE